MIKAGVGLVAGSGHDHHCRGTRRGQQLFVRAVRGYEAVVSWLAVLVAPGR